MSIAEDIMDGWCCQLCGVYFEEEHGYPVVCESCYNELSEEENTGLNTKCGMNEM